MCRPPPACWGGSLQGESIARQEEVMAHADRMPMAGASVRPGITTRLLPPQRADRD